MMELSIKRLLLKTDFGFLKSNRRREEIHFHYSQVLLPEDDDEGDRPAPCSSDANVSLFPL